ncbi:MAG: hypothetical protein AAGI44_05585 [Pseudomonadota bacterium]
MSTLQAFARIAFDAAGQTLVNPEAKARLIAATGHMPGVARTLLECRLAAADKQVDLSQSFLRADIPKLQFHLRQHAVENSPVHPGQRRVVEFLQQWCKPSHPFHKRIAGVWLEYDLPEQAAPGTALPGIFLDFEPVDASPESRAALRDVLQQLLLQWAGQGDVLAYLDVLEGYLSALPPTVGLSYLGLMASRDPFSLRVQFSGFSGETMHAFLQATSLQATPALADHLAEAVTLADEMCQSWVACIDLLPQLSPRVGLELFPSQYHEAVSDEVVIAKLMARGLCCQQKGQEALAWRGRLTPREAQALWPDDLLMESLLRNADEFGVIERRINHFKLLAEPQRALQAKVYLAADHSWVSFSEPDCPAREE